jgi:RNA polymerase sigma-70 factor (ECF subfamily)
LEELSLVKIAKEGNRKAQEAIYTRYADRMYRLCYRYIRNQEDAEDVLILSFTKVLEKIKNFEWRGVGSLEAWIKQIVVNESLMWLRRRHNFHLTEVWNGQEEEPDIAAISELEAEDIYRMIGELPQGYRTVFNLSVIEGYSHQEIADLLNISVSTSRTQLFKAKAHLKSKLSKEGFNYGT